MYEKGIVDVDKGKQCGARRYHCFHWIFRAPILPIFRYRSHLEIECQKFRQFLDPERTRNHGNTLKEPLSKFPVRVFNFPQGAFISPIQRVGQFVECMPNTPWEAVAEILELAIRPSKPTTKPCVRVVKT